MALSPVRSRAGCPFSVTQQSGGLEVVEAKVCRIRLNADYLRCGEMLKSPWVGIEPTTNGLTGRSSRSLP
jgi:hypothetical protein